MKRAPTWAARGNQNKCSSMTARTPAPIRRSRWIKSAASSAFLPSRQGPLLCNVELPIAAALDRAAFHPRTGHAARMGPAGKGSACHGGKEAKKGGHQGLFWNDAWVQRYGVGPGAGGVQLTRGSEGRADTRSRPPPRERRLRPRAQFLARLLQRRPWGRAGASGRTSCPTAMSAGWWNWPTGR